MPFSQRTRYLALTLTVLLAGGVEWYRGYPAIIVCLGTAGFVIAGNLWVYSLGREERERRRRKKMEYWTSS